MTGLFSPTHIAIILVVALLLFGPKKLPELGKSLGKGMREFKDSLGGKYDDEPTSPTPVEAPAPPVEAPAPHEHDPV
jgi:sec-independent protein translocase protein TatA